MEPEQRTYWMEVLGQLHTRLRQLALAGLIIFVVVSSNWFSRHQQLAEEQARIRPQLAEIVFASRKGFPESGLAEEIHEALNDPGCLLAPTAEVQHIAIDCISSLSKEVRIAEISSPEFKIFGQPLPKVLFRFVVLCAPIFLLIGTVVIASQLRALHSLLRTEVSHVSVQQKLNSPYFARVTRAYGEGRTSQILIVAAINFVHVLVAYMFVPAVLLLDNVVAVMVTNGRITYAAVVATDELRPDALSIAWGIGLIFALSLYASVVWIFARLVATHDPRSVKASGPN